MSKVGEVYWKKNGRKTALQLETVPRGRSHWRLVVLGIVWATEKAVLMIGLEGALRIDGFDGFIVCKWSVQAQKSIAGAVWVFFGPTKLTSRWYEGAHWLLSLQPGVNQSDLKHKIIMKQLVLEVQMRLSHSLIHLFIQPCIEQAFTGHTSRTMQKEH